MKKPINFLFWAAISGFTGVAFGAFGAHGLRDVLSADMLRVYKTGVDYHMWHALALGLIALLQRQIPADKILCWAGCLMIAGIIIFSGSLYLLSITGMRWLGAITPLGGLAFLSAWLLLAISAYKNTPNTFYQEN